MRPFSSAGKGLRPTSALRAPSTPSPVEPGSPLYRNRTLSRDLVNKGFGEEVDEEVDSAKPVVRVRSVLGRGQEPLSRPAAIHRVSKVLGTTEEGSLVITGQRKSFASDAATAAAIAALVAAGNMGAGPANDVTRGSGCSAPTGDGGSVDAVKAVITVAPPAQPASPSATSPNKPGRVLTPYEMQLAKLQAKYSKHNAAVAVAEAGGPEVVLPLYSEKNKEDISKTAEALKAVESAASSGRASLSAAADLKSFLDVGCEDTDGSHCSNGALGTPPQDRVSGLQPETAATSGGSSAALGVGANPVGAVGTNEDSKLALANKKRLEMEARLASIEQKLGGAPLPRPPPGAPPPGSPLVTLRANSIAVGRA